MYANVRFSRRIYVYGKREERDEFKMTRSPFRTGVRSSHSSRNTPCGISLGRCSPRYLLFCSIILARRCVLSDAAEIERRSWKRSHVRDKRARTILRWSVRRVYEKMHGIPFGRRGNARESYVHRLCCSYIHIRTHSQR